jgi:hypothetical protein
MQNKNKSIENVLDAFIFIMVYRSLFEFGVDTLGDAEMGF